MEKRERDRYIAQESVRPDFAGIPVFCMLYSIGMVASIAKLTSLRLADELSLLFLPALSVIGGTMFCGAVPKLRKWGFCFPLMFAGICVAFYGPARLFFGGQMFLNYLISAWNFFYQDGIPVMGSRGGTEKDLLAFLAVLLLLLNALFWYFIRKKAFVRMILFIIFGMLPWIMLKYSSPVGSALFLACVLGAWLLFFHSASRKRRIIWFLALGVLFLLSAFINGNRKLDVLVQLKKDTAQTWNTLRYGKDSLPEGNLKKADQMQSGERETLLVTTEQVKPLYLRGFTGANFQNDQWQPFTKAVYGGERWGFLDWISKQAFDVNAQYAAYQAVNEENLDQLPENHITINNKGANRKYIYTVYSADTPKGVKMKSVRDHGYRSSALFGNWVYSYSERSADLPGELSQLSSWVYEPQNDQQKEYLQGESVYRDFVYDQYLQIPETLQPVLNDLFSSIEERDAKIEGIYKVTQEIRSVMEKRFYYRKELETREHTDLLSHFLEGNIYGNSAYYASAGVLTFRKFGIPARYAEGYYLGANQIAASKNGTVSLKESDAHAWTEIYMDGMGWIPVDFTPGFYYNTYALLRMAELPQNIRRTAALEDQGEEAENVTGNVPQDGNTKADPKPETVVFLDTLLDITFVLLCFAELLFILLECSRIWYERKMQSVLQYGSGDCAEFLTGQISNNLMVCGIDVRPGWNTEQTEKAIQGVLPDIPDGFYTRVNGVLEKSIYGEGTLEPHELRFLHCFLLAIRHSKKQMGLKKRIAFRYIGLKNCMEMRKTKNRYQA